MQIISINCCFMQKQLHQGLRLDSKQPKLFLIGLGVPKHANEIADALGSLNQLV